jgi:lysozyme
MKPAIEYRTSEHGLDLIKSFESCKLVAYPDPKTGGDPWTVGWGATGPGIGPGTVWTQQHADDRLKQDVSEREKIVWRYVKVPITQGMFDALVSIVFNVGFGSTTRDGIIQLKNGQPSTLLRKLNASDYAGARAEFMKWVSPGSNVEKGLKRRRTAEVALWDMP